MPNSPFISCTVGPRRGIARPRTGEIIEDGTLPLPLCPDPIRAETTTGTANYFGRNNPPRTAA